MAEKGAMMSSRTRAWVLAISTPIIFFVVIGGYLGQAMTRDETYRHLSIFGDVFELVLDNYVEDVDVEKAMGGAMRGLADGLDPDSAFLSPALVKAVESTAPQPEGELGVELTRQYYLRIVSARDGSAAAKAGLRTGDYIRAIDGRATRDMSAYEGMRLLRGPAGSKVDLLVIRGNAAEPHELSVVRERITGPEIGSRMGGADIGYVRLVEFTADSPARLKDAFASLAASGATRYVIDLRGTARGDLDHGIAAARLFVPSGTLTVRLTKTGKEAITARDGDASITAPVVLLVDQGTAGAAELFAAALDGNKRADLVGERTLGRAARQQLVKLSDGSGLLLSSTRYQTPASEPIHEKGLTPDVEVAPPDVDFGAEPPAVDAMLEKALEQFTK
jgi:carboxyl-terminal processing protease